MKCSRHPAPNALYHTSFPLVIRRVQMGLGGKLFQKDVNKTMKFTISVVFLLLICSFVKGQGIDTNWYSETASNGVIIQNSYNRGGPYTGPVKKYFNVSNLIYFTRVINETKNSLELTVDFSADSIAIPNSPDTFVKLFLPPDTMDLGGC